ncbi:MlaD family protein [uncultured Alistipes sp.]|uniref:MCE family protein n=1 Tax=uncultured Alistipes sp. TaxID=538949 RepID=UPI001F961805|nr:MlaD family protein [uncultured Alistipes sp.]HJC27751.1 MCE family protein [Candidatus Alistipes stercoravium]
MKREVKIGVFAVAMILAAWAGIRFLKGFDIFGRNTVYYAAYDQIAGVQAASPVQMQGVKIGTVTGITLDPRRSDKVILQLTIKRQYLIPEDSEAKIISSSLMGAKAIEIIYGASSAYLEAGDTLRSGRDRDLMDMAGSELDFFKQKFSRIADDLSRTLDNVNLLLEENATNISGTLGNLNSVSGDVAELLETEKEHLHSAVQNLSAFADMLGENAPRVDSIVGSLNEVTAQLAEADFARRLSESVATLDDLLGRIESGDGSLGLLLNDRALYDSLTMASGNLASLLADLQEYPGRYVHFSLFGRDPEKMKAKADRRAAREAGKQFKDSLRRAQ